MPDSSAIDAALFAVLTGDAALTALLPDGFWYGEAADGAIRYGIVSLADATDARRFEGRSHEERLYLVKAVVRHTVGDVDAFETSRQAAARIDALLEGALLAATGYDAMACVREQPVKYVERDVVDRTMRFLHDGGQYRVVMSCQ